MRYSGSVAEWKKKMGDGFLQLKDQITKPYKILLRHKLSPGDIIVMSAAIENLIRNYPGEYRIAVDTNCMEIWDNNPQIEKWDNTGDWSRIDMEYHGIQQAGQRPHHFISAFTEHLETEIGRPLKEYINKPYIYLSDEEQEPFPDLPDKYCVLVCGRKNDYTTKFFGSQIGQEIVDAFPNLTFVQVGEINPFHLHPPLKGKNLINWIGKTSIRGLFRLIFNAVTVVSGVTMAHHVARAFEIPNICYNGGRENQSWVSYETTTFLSNVGQYDCCLERACWRARVEKLPDNNERNNNLCELPVLNSCGQLIPKCITDIGSEPAIKAIRNILALKENQ